MLSFDAGLVTIASTKGIYVYIYIFTIEVERRESLEDGDAPRQGFTSIKRYGGGIRFLHQTIPTQI